MRAPRRYARPANLAVARSVDGTLYLMALPDGPPRVLNGPAEAIWQAAVSGTVLIDREVADAFDVPAESIAKDVSDSLASFVEMGLLEVVAGTGES